MSAAPESTQLGSQAESPPQALRGGTQRPPHFLADVYSFDWTALNFALPAVSGGAVALCLFTGVATGHPAAGLIAGGGALTIGFGANQRIADSRLWPMILAIFAMASATLAGTIVGHRSWWMILASAISAGAYGVLTVRNTGLAWVGQQASVALFVASAFPSGPEPALKRAGLIVLGGTIQLLITSAGLRLMPELQKDLLAIPRSLYSTMYEQRRELLERLRDLPKTLPAPDRRATLGYSLRLVVTVALASWLYLRLGMQSGYWVPMTALLVQKPAFFETLGRAAMRVGGTLAGAYLATHLAAHLPLNGAATNFWLAGPTTFFAFWCFATLSVNYGLFSLCITSYIVFLLSLNQLPGPKVAHRRLWCTAAGAGIALLIHFDALRRHRRAADDNA